MLLESKRSGENVEKGFILEKKKNAACQSSSMRSVEQLLVNALQALSDIEPGQWALGDGKIWRALIEFF